MDFRQQNQPSSRPVADTPSVAPAHAEPKQTKNFMSSSKFENKWMRILSGVVLIGVAVLLIGIGLALSRGSTGESAYVNSSKYQAVFLNNGQVYFGSIQGISGEYVRLTGVFYLTQSDGNNSSNYTLVKLGCQQIHNPTDAMYINRSQVTFWENLNDNGKVVTSINDFKKQHPNGPDCSQVSNQTQASGNSSQTSQNSAGAGSTTPTNSSNSGTGTNNNPKSQ